jgi:ATP-dependent DNA helicase RecQ
LVRGGYARRAEEDFNALKVTDRGYDVLFRGEKVMLRSAPNRAPQGVRGGDDGQPHVALFDRLRTLRKRLADERGLPPYAVFPDTSLRQMAAQLPATREQLRRVQGVGERKLADFGDIFLSAITEYVRETGAQPTPAAEPAAPAAAPARRLNGGARLTPTAHVTLDLFRSGQSPAEIAGTRQLALTTVEEHLAAAVEAGAQIDFDRLVAPGKRRAIEAAISQVGAAFLRPIMDHLGDGYTYGEIKLVRAALNGGHRRANEHNN